MSTFRPALSRDPATPLYRQIYQRFRDAIAQGQLAPGDRVPSVRSLASELNLARGTVELAYQILIGEGYLVARGPAGTVVSPQLGKHAESPAPAPALRPHAPAQPERAAPLPFQIGLPALDAFPRMQWLRLAGRNLRAMDTAAMNYPQTNGHEPLRRAIAAYLGISRGISCSPGQVFITAGYLGALELICRTLLRSGDSGWYEDPGYPHGRLFLEQAGMRLAPVPVDEEGLCVQAGRQLAADARFAVLTPTHQSPLGCALTLPRRLALLEWAAARKAWIIEDDYDSEFRYHGRPLPALKSLDRDGRVLYTGTFSKVLYPGLRLAYLVVPEEQIAAFQATAAWLGLSSPTLLQATVADFMEQGHFARHLKKMRALYAERRAYLTDALARVFGDALAIPPRAGGIHVLAYWTRQRDDRSLAQAANAQGFAVHALNTWSRRDGTPPGMLLGFTNLASARQTQDLVQRLHKAIGQAA